MKKSKILCLLMIFGIAMSAFGIEVTGTAPTVSAPTVSDEPYATQIQNALDDAFQQGTDTVIGDLNEMVGGIAPIPKQLIQAFGNSSVYASHGATNRGYGGYKALSINIGTMVGVQLPVGPFEIVNALDTIPDRLLSNGDLPLGANPQLFNAHVGFNASFLVKNLYLGVRLGFLDLPKGSIQIDSMGDFSKNLSFKTTTIGVTANYQLIPSISLAGLITWRGINIGSGIIFSTSNLNFAMPLDFDPFDLGSGATLNIDPEITFDLSMTTVTIPVEAVTAIKLLFINIPIGVGADIAFGKTDMRVGMDAAINVDAPGLTQESPGSLSVSAGGSMAPQFLNLKLMTGLGFVFGPVVLDIPVTWYFADNGFNVGITLGVSF